MIVVSEMILKIMNDARKRVEEATESGIRKKMDIDLLIEQSVKLIEEIEMVSSEDNTPAELEYIEALEMQLDKYLVAIRYS